MASNEDYKPSEKDGKKKEAISLQSDPQSTNHLPPSSNQSTRFLTEKVLIH